MRNLLTAMMVVGLLAAPSLGAINVKLVALDNTLNPGESTTVQIWGQGSAAGLFALGGYISATGTDDVLTSVGEVQFDAGFSPTGFFTPKSFSGGTNYAKGGFGDLSPANSGFGSQQTDWSAPSGTVGKADYALVGWYTVTADAAVTAPKSVTLAFNSKTVGGYKPMEVDKSATLGTLTNATITVVPVPEPVTMALLAVGGLLVARRRR